MTRRLYVSPGSGGAAVGPVAGPPPPDTPAWAAGRPPRAFVVVYVVCTAGLVSSTAASGQDPLVQSLGVLLLAVTAYPLASLVVRRTPELPVFEFYCAMFAIQYAYPAATNHTEFAFSVPFTRASLVLAEELVLAGFGAFVLGYRWKFRSAAVSPAGRQSIQIDPSAARRLAYILLMLSLFAQFILTGRVPGSFRWFVQFFVRCSLFSVVIFYALHLRKECSAFDRGVAIIALLRETQLGVGTSHLAKLMMLALLLVCVHVSFRGRVPLVSMAAFAVAMIPLFQFRSEFRKAVWLGQARISGSPVMYYLNLGWKGVRESRRETMQGGFDYARNRANVLSMLAVVLDETPSRIPYWYGRSYLIFFSNVFIPRFLWPNKPINNFGQVFGWKYRFIRKENRRTAVNCPQLVEFYFNFGVPGVIVGMLGMGMLLSWAIRHYVHRNLSFPGYLLLLVAMSKMFSIESNLALLLSEAIKEVFMVWLIMRVTYPVLPVVPDALPASNGPGVTCAGAVS